MKRMFFVSLAAASLLSATAYADDIDDSPDSSSNQVTVESKDIDSSTDESAANDVTITNDSASDRNSGWRSGIGLKLGAGPAFDLLDPCYGYSARIGVDIHGKYWGINLEVAWNTVWTTASPSRPNHRNDFADKTTNSGLMMFVLGYLPFSDHLIMSLGAGAGMGIRYEDFSDNPKEKRTSSEADLSWLMRFQTGIQWLVTDSIALGFDLELNLGGYLGLNQMRWNSDDKRDYSLGTILTLSYQFFSNG